MEPVPESRLGCRLLLYALGRPSPETAVGREACASRTEDRHGWRLAGQSRAQPSASRGGGWRGDDPHGRTCTSSTGGWLMIDVRQTRATSPSVNLFSRLSSLLLHATSALFVLLALALLATPRVSAESNGVHGAANQPPRIAALSARIGRVHIEGGRSRSGGVLGTYRLCDDGPESGQSRNGLIRVVHRSGTSLLVREQYPSISWDIYFATPECRSQIAWSSTIPADLPELRKSRCYSVSISVRDPGGRWSNTVTRAVTKCGKS